MPARTVAAIRGTVDHRDVLAWYDAAMAELDAVAQAAHQRRPGHPAAATPTSCSPTAAATCWSTVRSPTRRAVGRVTARRPAGRRARHHRASRAARRHRRHLRPLGAWVVDHALAVDGPVHETYLVGPRDTPTPAPGAPRSAGRSSAWPPITTPRGHQPRYA